MPFTMHADLLSMYFRAHLMAEYGLWRLPSGQYLGHMVYAIDLLMMKLAGWDLKSLFPLPFGLQPGSMTASVGNWLAFQSLPGINQALFWWKIPHLLADLAVFGLLARLFSRSKQLNLVLAAWWLNPVNFYAFYVFARHDAMTALVMLLVILFTVQKKLWPAMVGLFAAFQVRVQPLLLAPLLLVTWWKSHSWSVLIKNLLFSSLIIGVYLWLVSHLPGDVGVIEQLTGQARATNAVQTLSVPGGRFTDEVIYSAFGGWPIFLVAYGAIGLIAWLFSRPKKGSNRLEYVNAWLLVVMAIYFAVNKFSPHYFVWLSLFWTIGVGFNKRLIWPYVGAVFGWLIMGLTAQDSFSINQNLFLPLAPGLFRTPQLPVLLMSRGIDPNQLFMLGRLVLTGSLLWLAWQTWQASLRPTLNWRFNWRKIFQPGVWVVGLLISSLVFTHPVQAITTSVFEQKIGNELIYLEANKPYSQNFISPVDQFGALEIQFATDRVMSGQQVIFRIKPSFEETWTYEGHLNRDDLYNYAYYPIGFPPFNGAKDRTFTFELELTHAETDRWTAIVGNSTGANFRLLSEDTALFKQQTIERLRNTYQAQPIFWWFYGALLGILGVSLLTILAFPLEIRKEKQG